ncbi:hypothetical protein [Agarivorans sp. JK6]|uniref:hypothetical protein n=1 Tax=Agarivorans sp. JK6 TaxID=2997426 RepID=UPI0038730A9C
MKDFSLKLAELDATQPAPTDIQALIELAGATYDDLISSKKEHEAESADRKGGPLETELNLIDELAAFSACMWKQRQLCLLLQRNKAGKNAAKAADKVSINAFTESYGDHAKLMEAAEHTKAMLNVAIEKLSQGQAEQ